MTAHLSIATCLYIALGVLAWAADFWWPFLALQGALGGAILAGVAVCAVRLARRILVAPRCERCLARTRRRWRGRYQCERCCACAPVSCVEETERVDDFTKRAA